MGHTVSSQRQVCEQIIRDMGEFKKSLKADERKRFTRLMNAARKHYGSITYTSSYHTWAIMLLAMLLEQEKELEAYRERFSS